MMHSLLKRQIRKFLPDTIQESELKEFLNAIESSYKNFDEQMGMMQHATTLSSQELFEANNKLREEAESQKKILESLGRAVDTLGKSAKSKKNVFYAGDFNPLSLAKDIEKQAQLLAKATTEKDILLKNLERQNEALNNYAHMVSHDLKSPMRNIDTLLNWFIEDNRQKLSDGNLAEMDTIFQNLNKMEKIINGILEHSTLESYKEERISIALHQLLEEIKSSLEIPDHVSVTFDEQLPTLFAEKYKIEQLFKNLIENAVTATKHLDQGKIHVEFKNIEGFWQFSVHDNGKGIAPQHQDSIFDMFKKLENNYNATGIGLL